MIMREDITEFTNECRKYMSEESVDLKQFPCQWEMLANIDTKAMHVDIRILSKERKIATNM